mmetsp:Transcript_122756/g.333398  ORF Transcript_122756/g.333398 Transcript_122756/m.333398 type:complete len:257 (+) Transcript_122756:282-1052(+)
MSRRRTARPRRQAPIPRPTRPSPPRSRWRTARRPSSRPMPRLARPTWPRPTPTPRQGPTRPLARPWQRPPSSMLAGRLAARPARLAGRPQRLARTARRLAAGAAAGPLGRRGRGARPRGRPRARPRVGPSTRQSATPSTTPSTTLSTRTRPRRRGRATRSTRPAASRRRWSTAAFSRFRQSAAAPGTRAPASLRSIWPGTRAPASPRRRPSTAPTTTTRCPISRWRGPGLDTSTLSTSTLAPVRPVLRGSRTSSTG